MDTPSKPSFATPLEPNSAPSELSSSKEDHDNHIISTTTEPDFPHSTQIAEPTTIASASASPRGSKRTRTRTSTAGTQGATSLTSPQGKRQNLSEWDPPTPTSRFLALPGELKNKIYGLVLRPDEPVLITARFFNDQRLDADPIPVLPAHLSKGPKRDKRKVDPFAHVPYMIFHASTPEYLQILRVNRQIYFEAAAEAYKHLFFDCPVTLLAFITRLEASRREGAHTSELLTANPALAMIKYVTVNRWAFFERSFWILDRSRQASVDLSRALSKVSNMEKLVIKGPIGDPEFSYDGNKVADYINKVLWRWFEWVGRSKGIDAAIDMVEVLDQDFWPSTGNYETDMLAVKRRLRELLEARINRPITRSNAPDKWKP